MLLFHPFLIFDIMAVSYYILYCNRFFFYLALISHLIKFLCKTCQKSNWNDDDDDNNNNNNDNDNNNNNNSNNNGALTFTIPVFSNKFL